MTGSAPLIMSLRPMLILNKSQIKPILPTCQDQSLCYTCYIVYLLYLTQYIYCSIDSTAVGRIRRTC